MHTLEITADGFGPERHRAVDQGADPDGTTALDIDAEARRDFNRYRDVAVLEALVDLVIRAERPLLHEIGRASEFFQIGAAFVTLVAVEHCKRQVVDVRRNSESEYQHQKRRSKQAEPEPDRVAQQLKGLADRIGEQALQAEHGMVWRR